MSDTAKARQLTEPQRQGLRLVVYPPKAPAGVKWIEGSLHLGRDASNGLRLDDARVSSSHLRLRRRRDTARFELVDQGSSNGTFLDGMRVDAAVVDDGSVIRLGDTLIVAEIGHQLAGSEDPSRSLASVVLDADADRAASLSCCVLLLGPHGSGKSHLAKQIAASPAREGPFVAVNCAAIPAELVESELFGYVAGAFTGAGRDKTGLIRSADGGTLLLDEIGATSAAFQAKLLTCIEEGAVRPVGATRSESVDVRYLAATNVDPAAAIAEGALRDDLHARLAALTITVPPLVRRRVEVLPLLCQRAGLTDHRAFTAEALEALLNYPWPGNVREVLQLGETLGPTGDGPVDYHALPTDMWRFLRDRREGQEKADRVGGPPREVLAAELEAAGGNVSELARRLGEHRNQVVRWLRAHGLRRR